VRNKPPLWYTIQAIVGTFIEEAVLVVIVLWVLPYFGVRAPLWVLGLLMLALAVLACVRYRLGRTTFFLPRREYVESLVGCEGMVTSPLNPEGYVKVQGVLWKASCIEDHLDEGAGIDLAVPPFFCHAGNTSSHW